MSAHRAARPLISSARRVHRAERRWETLAAGAGIDDACDARLCAKLAKVRKQVWRSERRMVRRLLKDAA